jgi:hypothetical protein
MDTDRFVLDQNISHYREQLNSETNPARREVLAKLLADANAELARLLHTTAARSDLTLGAVEGSAGN